METGADFPKQTTVECLSVAAHGALCMSALVIGQKHVSLTAQLFSAVLLEVGLSRPTLSHFPLSLFGLVLLVYSIVSFF